MIFNPLGDNIIATPEKAEEKTKSGIFLGPPGKREQPRTAIALAVGPKVEHIKVGDRFLFQAFATSELKVGDDEYLAIKEEFVVATIKEAKK